MTLLPQAVLERHGDTVQLRTCLGLISTPFAHTMLVRVTLLHVELAALAHLAGDEGLVACVGQDRPLHAIASLWQADQVWPGRWVPFSCHAALH